MSASEETTAPRVEAAAQPLAERSEVADQLLPEASEPAEQPLVTIIVPTYNRRELVAQTIDSVLAQDYPNLELLVLDDGSTDGTPEVLERYAREHPNRFRWDRHDNMGQARTLNRGFEMMRGEFVGYLSSDDLLLPGAITKLSAALVEDPEAVVVYPAFHMVNKLGEHISTMVPPEWSTAEALRLHNCIVNVGAIYRRRVIDEIGGWDPSYTYVADFDFFVRAGALGPFRRLTEPLACWRAHPGSANAAPGLLGAREQTLLLDKVYSDENVSEELLEVREEAYRNAHFVAAYAMGRVNTAGERFYVHDTLAREVSSKAPAKDAELIARLRKRIAHLERRERTLEQALEQAEGTGAGRRRRGDHPLWWRAARRVVPSGLRPRGRAALERVLGSRLPPSGMLLPDGDRRTARERTWS